MASPGASMHSTLTVLPTGLVASDILRTTRDVP